MQQLNQKTRTLFEVLEEASKSDTPVDVLKKSIGVDKRVFDVLAYAFNPNFKMNMPESDPPYIPSTFPLGVAPMELLHLSSKLYIVYSKETKQYKKEEIFIRWLEEMSPEEAKILIAIKDRSLSKMYPFLTDDVVCSTMGWKLDQLLDLRRKAG